MYRKVQHLDRVIHAHGKSLEKQQGYRLFLGVATFALLVASQMFKGLYLELGALFFTLPPYIYFFVQTRMEKEFIEGLKRLRAFYQKQIAIKAGEKIESSSSRDFPNDELSRDLDLWEFFPYIDQTLTLEGEERLKKELTGCSLVNLEDRHKKLQRLASYPGRLRKLHTLPLREKLNLKDIEDTLKQSFLPSKSLSRWTLLALWTLTLLLLFVEPRWAVYSFIPFILITLQYLQETHSLFSRLQNLQRDLAQLEPIFLTLAGFPKSIILAPQWTQAEPLSHLKKIKTFVSLQSFRANPFIYYLINFILPWSVLINELSEKQRKNIAHKFQDWKKELVEFEVVASLATIYIYQTKTLAHEGSFSAQNLIHPLLGRQKAIPNNFGQDPKKSLFLITGSNMSGKSTFLRSMGINFCLARMGAPVWADDFHFPNIPITTCIRVSDSLRDGKSYFFSEVLRLKKILNQAKEGSVFFLIDEPLKGTNNRERLAGNQAFLEQLVQTNSLGFIATHDLDLTSLESKIEPLKNFHFTESWKNQELYFDYKIKSGPSESTNALKIMEREGLVPSL